MAGPAKGGNPVPDRFFRAPGLGTGGSRPNPNNVEILDGLGVNMDFAPGSAGNSYNLAQRCAPLGWPVLTWSQKRKRRRITQIHTCPCSARGSRWTGRPAALVCAMPGKPESACAHKSQKIWHRDVVHCNLMKGDVTHCNEPKINAYRKNGEGRDKETQGFIPQDG